MVTGLPGTISAMQEFGCKAATSFPGHVPQKTLAPTFPWFTCLKLLPHAATVAVRQETDVSDGKTALRRQ